MTETGQLNPFDWRVVATSKAGRSVELLNVREKRTVTRVEARGFYHWGESGAYFTITAYDLDADFQGREWQRLYIAGGSWFLRVQAAIPCNCRPNCTAVRTQTETFSVPGPRFDALGLVDILKGTWKNKNPIAVLDWLLETGDEVVSYLLVEGRIPSHKLETYDARQ